MNNNDLRRAIAEINVDDDRHPEGNLQYVLIRGFSSMGWSQPTNASNDVLDAILKTISSFDGDRNSLGEGMTK